MTYYERIKNMSIDEMANMLMKIKSTAFEKAVNKIDPDYKVSDEAKQNALKVIKKYLEGEVKNDG